MQPHEAVKALPYWAGCKTTLLVITNPAEKTVETIIEILMVSTTNTCTNITNHQPLKKMMWVVLAHTSLGFSCFNNPPTEDD